MVSLDKNNNVKDVLTCLMLTIYSIFFLKKQNSSPVRKGTFILKRQRRDTIFKDMQYTLLGV
jgi:hypothetical protein